MKRVVILHQVNAEMFWSCVDTAGDKDCWPWAGAVSQSGYGTLYVLGRTVGAHRVAWSLRTGRDPKPGEVVRHTCDNPPCCNPNHLAVGTVADNNRDIAARRWNLPYPALNVARLLADGATEDDLVRIFHMHPDTARRYVALGPQRTLLRNYRPKATRPPAVDRRRHYDREHAERLAGQGATVEELRGLGMSRATAYRLIRDVRHQSG